MQIDWGDLGDGADTKEVNFGISVEDGVDFGISLESGTEVRALNKNFSTDIKSLVISF